MSEQTKIAWCDSTVNFWIGCTKVLDQNGKLTDSGCKECYADAQDRMRFSRNLGGGTKQNPIPHWGKGVPRYKVEGAVKSALAMNRRPWISDSTGSAYSSIELSRCGCADRAGFHLRRIFSLSLGDIMDEEVEIEMLYEALFTIWKCRECVWILCSKRWQNFVERMAVVLDMAQDKDGAAYPETEANAFWWWIEHWITGEQPPKNIILLASVENQAMADKRIPELLKIPAACRGLSIEPCIGPVNVVKWLYEKQRNAVLGDGGTRLVSSGQSGQDLAQPPIFGRPNSQRDKNTGDASRAQQVEKGRVSASLVSESGLLKTTEGGRPQNLLDGSQSPPDTRRHGDKPQAQGRGQIQKPSRQSGIGNEIGERDSLLPSSGAQTESADRREKLNVETHGGTSDKNSCALENQTIQPAGNRDDVRCESDLHIGRGKGQDVEPSISWLIIGCESGPHRRDCKLEWVRSLAAQGKSAGVATFIKQLQDSEGMVCKDVSEFPEDLRIQQWPQGF